jgi:hypothetical protein
LKKPIPFYSKQDTKKYWVQFIKKTKKIISKGGVKHLVYMSTCGTLVTYQLVVTTHVDPHDTHLKLVNTISSFGSILPRMFGR